MKKYLVLGFLLLSFAVVTPALAQTVDNSALIAQLQAQVQVLRLQLQILLLQIQLVQLGGVATTNVPTPTTLWANIAPGVGNPFGDHYFIIQPLDHLTWKASGTNLKVVYGDNPVLIQRMAGTNGSNDQADDFGSWLDAKISCYNQMCPGPTAFQVVGTYTNNGTSIKLDKIIQTVQ